MAVKTKTIKRLLIANRGEIACRIAATARQMGIEVITVFAQNDAALPHATVGDYGVLLEGDTLAETYLNIPKLIDIAKTYGADAIHPGYGFLSENAKFADAIEKAALIFVGPTSKIISDMGDKAASRQLCDSIGVPTVPGFDKEGADEKTLMKEALKIGFPLMVKASAGGGGKGMRIVTKESELAEAIARAKSEAKASFGDDRLIVERYLTKPRHIEVQVFSDQHGNHLHLFERECSIQRRHQKIIEESPSAILPDATKEKMFAAATTLTKHINYVGAGTVEFILDASGEFYFLEMNTRLQVEHPVTEWVTGVDLVRMQLEAAMGKKLDLKQADITQNGHAVEVRLYAEDAARDFMPAPGDLISFHLPPMPYVRLDTGYVSGSTVSASYDPMIAKMIAWGETREVANARMQDALRRIEIAGVTSNRAFLLKSFAHEVYQSGDISTDFIPDHKDALLSTEMSDETRAQLAAAYLLFGKRTKAAQAGGEGTASQQEHSAWTQANVKVA